MIDHDWTSLRPEDWAPGEGDGADPEHRRAMGVAAEVAALPGTPGPSAEDVLERISRGRRMPPGRRRSRWVPWVATGVALAAAATAVVAVMPAGTGSRDKGVAAPPGEVQLRATAESGPGDVRALGDGGEVRVDEKVAFLLRTTGDGWLSLTEDGVVLWQARVDAGDHVPGGSAAPQVFATDAGPGSHDYAATLCATPGEGCTTARLNLVWRRE